MKKQSVVNLAREPTIRAPESFSLRQALTYLTNFKLSCNGKHYSLFVQSIRDDEESFV
jgi:hypothetical protein